MAERYADLEIAFRWVEEPNQQGLDVGLRFVLSDQPVDNWKHPLGLLKIDLQELAGKANDVDSYAEALTRMVFSRDDIAEFYTAAAPAHRTGRSTCGSTWMPRPALHRVRWELLRDPGEGHPVATSDGILFSRYLSSPDFRMLPWRTKQATRALVVIAAPSDLGEYAPGGQRAADVKVDMERRSAGAALGNIQTVFFAGTGAGDPCQPGKRAGARGGHPLSRLPRRNHG